MVKVDVFSGFLGAGKTTLIRKLLKEAYKGEKLVLVENEFGDVSVDGNFVKDSEAQLDVTELYSGCVCCSLSDDFDKQMVEIVTEQHPDRILLEPSGVAKLSDIIFNLNTVAEILKVRGAEEICVNALVTAVDARKCAMYLENFGEFYENQVQNASCILLSRTGELDKDVIDECVAALRALNPKATIVTTPWDMLDGLQILKAMEGEESLTAELTALQEEEEHCHHHEHHHHHHGHDEDADEDEDEDEHEHEHHHHHEHDEEDEHEHHHDHDHHHHHHHHGHDADEEFTSWGREGAFSFTKEQIEEKLHRLDAEPDAYGQILRAKGTVASPDGTWVYFDYVPGEISVREGAPCVTGRLCVIGAKIDEEAVEGLFA